jgi:hypothetical protein
MKNYLTELWHAQACKPRHALSQSQLPQGLRQRTGAQWAYLGTREISCPPDRNHHVRLQGSWRVRRHVRSIALDLFPTLRPRGPRYAQRPRRIARTSRDQAGCLNRSLMRWPSAALLV